MTAYKFLTNGARGPLSGFTWPLPRGDAPGAWVEARPPLVPSRWGVHVCRAIDLAHWMHDELWQLDIDGQRIDGPDCLVVERARLVRRLEGWSTGGGVRFAEACIEHAVALATDTADVHAFIDDARMQLDAGAFVFAAFCTANAVGRSAGAGDVAREQAFRDERRWQSAWIAREIAGRP